MSNTHHTGSHTESAPLDSPTAAGPRPTAAGFATGVADFFGGSHAARTAKNADNTTP